ncbi:MAG: relaxase/mobilization nuclease domain-containing protein [Bergeyella sp.]
MIVKINPAAGKDFPGVNYNDKKVESGKGELMLMKNFPESINEESSTEEVKNYLSAVSKNEKVKKPQFHAVLSTKFREHSKEELTQIAEKFMEEMGYGEQPFIVVHHNDTENNHVHVVSTRVDKTSGKKINDSFEKLKSQKALAKVMEKLYGNSQEETLEKLLNYKIGSLKQLELLLERNGFKMVKNKRDENSLDILKNGVTLKSINGNQIMFDNKKNDLRAKQIRAFLSKYKEVYSNKVFKVEDRRKQDSMLPDEKTSEDWKPKIEFESELQKKMKEMFGIDIVFHHKDGMKPFGYSLIDNHTGRVFKGSDLVKMNEIFEFTDDTIDKRLFESIKDFNIQNQTYKNILLQYLNQKSENKIQDFMLFESKGRKSKEVFSEIRNDVKALITKSESDKVDIFKADDGKDYAIHLQHHFIGEVKDLVGEKMYQNFSKQNDSTGKIIIDTSLKILEELSKSTGSSGTAKDPAEDELLKRKRRKRKK